MSNNIYDMHEVPILYLMTFDVQAYERRRRIFDMTRLATTLRIPTCTFNLATTDVIADIKGGIIFQDRGRSMTSHLCEFAILP